MKIVSSSGTIVPTYQIKTLHHISKDHNLDTHHYESLRVHIGKGKHVLFLTVTPWHILLSLALDNNKDKLIGQTSSNVGLQNSAGEG